MRIRIKDDLYDIQDVVDGASLGSLRSLKAASGESVKTIAAAFAWAAEQTGLGSADLFDNADFIGAVIALIYLARRSDGTPITWDEASAVKPSDFDFLDDEEEETVPDPKDEPSEAAAPPEQKSEN